MIERRTTRPVRVGNLIIGGDAPIVLQSMAATKTRDIEATVQQVKLLDQAGAQIVRIAIDSDRDVEALREIHAQTPNVIKSVDLQENWELSADLAPFVGKIRYNPGHLYHHKKNWTTREKVEYIAEAAAKYDCAIRIGVNYGSVDPEIADKFPDDPVGAMVASAVKHAQDLEDLKFPNYVVSLKHSTPQVVIDANMRFAKLMPHVPLHLGVTEAGRPQWAEAKTRKAFHALLGEGIGETIRPSITLPFEEKGYEIDLAKRIIDDVNNGRSYTEPAKRKFNIVSCPSCSRVENEKFVDFAIQLEQYADEIEDQIPDGEEIIGAVMGCRVNGPGETDDADIGIWFGPRGANFKRGEEKLGFYSHEDILPMVKSEIARLIEEKSGSKNH